jgi:hypothetical protein
MSLSSQALTSLQKLFQHLKVPSNEEAAFTSEAESLIEQASAAAGRHTGRKMLRQEAVSQVYDGNGRQSLFLREYPAVVTSVVVNGVEVPEKTTWDGLGWDLDPEGDDDHLRLYGYAFNPGRQNVEVYGSFGYTSTSPEGLVLERAALEWAAYFHHRRVPGVTTENFEGVSVTYGSDEMPRQVKNLLARFVKWEVS